MFFYDFAAEKQTPHFQTILAGGEKHLGAVGERRNSVRIPHAQPATVCSICFKIASLPAFGLIL